MRGIVVYSLWLTLIEEHRTLPKCLGLTSQLMPLFSYEGKTSKAAYSKRCFFDSPENLDFAASKECSERTTHSINLKFSEYLFYIILHRHNVAIFDIILQTHSMWLTIWLWKSSFPINPIIQAMRVISKIAALCLLRTLWTTCVLIFKVHKFEVYFGHDFRPVTHYGVVIKRCKIAENNRRANIHTYYEATDTFRGLFFKIWANNRFSSLKMQGGPDELGKFSYFGQIDLKMTGMARFMKQHVL